MLVDLLKPVTVQRAEAVSKRMRTLATDPSNGILPIQVESAWFRAASQPVPQIITDLAVKYRFQNFLPFELRNLRDAPALRQDPRMANEAIARPGPNDHEFWRRVTLTEREREEVRRVMQRENWSEREIKFITNRHGHAALLYTLDYHRKRVIADKDRLEFLRDRFIRRYDKLKLAREELSALIALCNHDRAWVAKLMSGRHADSLEIAETHNQKLAKLENDFYKRDLLTMQDKRVDQAAQNLAAYVAANAYKTRG